MADATRPRGGAVSTYPPGSCLLHPTEKPDMPGDPLAAGAGAGVSVLETVTGDDGACKQVAPRAANPGLPIARCCSAGEGITACRRSG